MHLGWLDRLHLPLALHQAHQACPKVRAEVKREGKPSQGHRLFKTLCTSHQPSPHWPGRVTLPGPEPKKEVIADDVARCVQREGKKVWDYFCNLPH